MQLKSVLLALLYVLSIAASSFSQETLKGIIKDADSDKPVNGVHVFIPELQKGTVTNMSGEFRLNHLPASQLNIQFSHIGYKVISKTINPGKDSLSRLDIYLEPTAIHSDAVVVSAGTFSTQHENAIKIETIKSKDFEKKNASLLTAKIAEVPGVDLISKGNAVVKPVIRGLSNSNILVLNNGVKMENYQFSENHPFLIDEFGVDRVEVIKGPASLLYGSDAVGGIINVIGEKPASTQTMEAEFIQQYHSNTNGLQTNIGVKQTFDDFFWGLRGGIKKHEDFHSSNDQVIPNSRFNNLGIHAFTGLNKSYGSFRIYYDYTRMQLGMTVPGIDTIVNTGARENNFWYQNLDNHIISSKNKLFIKDLKLETDFSFQQNNRELITIDKKAVDMRMSVLNADIKTKYAFNLLTDMIIGMQGSLKENQNFDAPNRVLPDHKVYDAALFGLLQRNFDNGLKTQAGVRLDYRKIQIPDQVKSGHSHNGNETGDHDDLLEKFSSKYNNLSFSLGATYKLNHNILFRSNIASAYRTPNVAELTQDGVHGTRFEKGNRELHSQKNYEADLSFHYHCCHALFDISGFYNNVRDYIFLAPTDDFTTDGFKIYQYEQTHAHLYGGEILFETKPANFMKGFMSFSTTSGEQNNGSNLPFIPHDKLRSGLSLEIEGDNFIQYSSFTISTTYAFKQDNPSRFETKTPDYFLTDLKLNSEWVVLNQKFLLNASIQNLFDVRYIDHLSTLKSLNYYNMGRNFIFSLTIPIVYKM